MKKQLTKAITTGAAATAFFVIVYSVIALNESTVQEIVALLAILPLAVYTCMFGARAGGICTASAVLLSMFLVQPTVLVTYAIPNALIGYILGLTICRINIIHVILIIAGLNILQFGYEFLVTKLVFKVDAWKEYSSLINTVTAIFKNGSIASVLAHDMTFYSIPALFILAAFARACIHIVAAAIILFRLFKKQITIKLPRLRLNRRLFAYIYFAVIILSAILATLTLTAVIPYSFLTALFLDIVIVLMYIYLLFSMRTIGKLIASRTLKGFILTLLLIIFFPVTDTVFAVISIKGR